MKRVNKPSTLTTVISSLILTIGFFTGCSDGGDSASFENSEIQIPIDINCTTSPTSIDIANYISLYIGDVIVKDNDGAEISIYHDINGTKKVCLVTPSAYIIRK